MTSIISFRQPYSINFHATHPGEDSFGEKAIGNTLVIGKSGNR